MAWLLNRAQLARRMALAVVQLALLVGSTAGSGSAVQAASPVTPGPERPSAAQRSGNVSIPNWTELQPPMARVSAAMVFDGATQNVLLYGGEAGSALRDMWTWDGSLWHQRFPSNTPSTLYASSATYDAAHRQVVLYGGISGTVSYDNQTWTWDGVTWTQQLPATSPPARNQASMAYSGELGSVVLFGGAKPGTAWNDTWAWNGTNWTQVSTASSPSGREDQGMAYDATTRSLLMYGGFATSGDTWILR